MAELSHFFGIIFRMFAEHGGKHHTPHFHAVYQEHEAVFTVDPVHMLSGFLPIKQQRMVEAWAEIHQDELIAAWQSLDSGKKPQSIKPLGESERTTMKHPIYHVTAFEIVAPDTLRIQFDDHSEQTINFEPILRGEIFGPLRDLNLFNKVRLDLEVRTLIWPNDADFDPADLHDWPEIEKGFIEHAMQWELT